MASFLSRNEVTHLLEGGTTPIILSMSDQQSEGLSDKQGPAVLQLRINISYISYGYNWFLCDSITAVWSQNCLLDEWHY